MTQRLTSKTEIVKKASKQKLTSTEEKIYRYIQNKPDKVLLMSLKEISNKLEVAEGSVLNFCRNVLELKGFIELKLQIAEDLSKTDSTTPEVDNSVFTTKEYEYEKMFDNIKKDFDDEKIKKANELFNNANKVLIIDTENSALSIIAEQLLFEEGKKEVDSINNLNFSFKKLFEMDEDDLLFILSTGDDKFSNYSEFLEASNSKIVAITKNRLNKISQKSDLVFYTRTDNREMKFSSFVIYLELLILFLNIEK